MGWFQHSVIINYTVTDTFGQIPFIPQGCFRFALPTGQREGVAISGFSAPCPVSSGQFEGPVIYACFPHGPVNTVCPGFDCECVVLPGSDFNFHGDSFPGVDHSLDFLNYTPQGFCH